MHRLAIKVLPDVVRNIDMNAAHRYRPYSIGSMADGAGVEPFGNLQGAETNSDCDDGECDTLSSESVSIFTWCHRKHSHHCGCDTFKEDVLGIDILTVQGKQKNFDH